MDARRLRLITIVAILGLSALVLLAGTQSWWSIALSDTDIEVGGTVVSPALPALALSGMALAAALTIAGPFFRVVLGVLQLLVSGTMLAAIFSTLSDPVLASAALITEATGVAGNEPIRAVVEGVAYTAWPWFAVTCGVLSLLVGVFLLATVRFWPATSSKYQAIRLEREDGDPAGDWDALSDGSDPTER